MSRPPPEVIISTQLKNGTLIEITRPERVYIITYMDEPVGIREQRDGFGAWLRKYKKNSYQNLGSAVSQVERLNKLFNTDAFGYREV